MAKPKKRKKLDKQTHILQLPEELFRQIFDHLDPETLFLVVRKVCQTTKYYVDGYMKPDKIYVPAAGRQMTGDIQYEFIHKKKPIVVCSKLASPLMFLSSKERFHKMQKEKTAGCFGAMYEDKIVIGNHPKFSQYLKMYMEPGERDAFKEVAFTLFKFDPIENEWKWVEFYNDSFFENVEFWSKVDNFAFVLFCRKTKSHCGPARTKTTSLILLRIDLKRIDSVGLGNFANQKKVIVFTEGSLFQEIPEEPRRIMIRIK